jgi:hypothetical protein
MRRSIAILGILAATSLCGGDLPPEIRAKVVKLLAASAGSPGKVACKDPALSAELAKGGCVNEPGAMVAYATSEEEVRSLRGAGKLVICGRVSLLAAGAAAAVVEEENRPQIYFHMAHLNETKVTLSDAVLKIGRKL